MQELYGRNRRVVPESAPRFVLLYRRSEGASVRWVTVVVRSVMGSELRGFAAPQRVHPRAARDPPAEAQEHEGLLRGVVQCGKPAAETGRGPQAFGHSCLNPRRPDRGALVDGRIR